MMGKFQIFSLAAFFFVMLFIPTKTWAAQPPTPSVTVNKICTYSNTDYLVYISWGASSPAVSYVDISPDTNFSYWYNSGKYEGIPGNYIYASAGYNSTGFIGQSGTSVAGQRLTLQAGTTYYVRLWNGSLPHSNKVSFTMPATPPNTPCITLSGRVTDTVTSNAMSGVTINTCDLGYSVTTNSSGYFYFYNVPYNNNFCLRPAAVSGYSGPNRTYECQSAGYFKSPDLCGYSPSNDLAADNTYNFTYTADTPNCNDTPSCSGSCAGAAANTCTNNGTKSGCVYTTYTGGGTCNQVAAPNQPCNQPNCSANYSCVGGSCVLQNCNASLSCNACSGAPANSCALNNGTQTCQYTRLNGSTTCNSTSFTQNCNMDTCAPLVCDNIARVCVSSTSCGAGTARSNGLVSTPAITSGSKFNTTGACIVDTKASFAPYKLPSYDDLKSKYYNQAKTVSGIVTKETTITDNPADQGDIPLNRSPEHLYYATGNMNIDNPIPGGQTGVVFIDGNLNINRNIVANPPNTGIVFVVKGNVNIHQNTTQVDAVIIAEGEICTAFDGTSCMDGRTVTQPLTINGSLISLEITKPIKFKRDLADNSQAAERIFNQPKYLVILRNLFADTLQKWSEIQ